jgi:DNA-binding winged helix-turn-helix (wHTH) protein
MDKDLPKRPRYCFSDFTVSPSRRVLLRHDEELPLIPRYLDLLLLLIERRNEAIHRRDIFDTVWNDVVVTDGALSQAVRILRRTLGDNSREPMFIRTVSRHGYRFVFPDVTEEDDAAPLPISGSDSANNGQRQNDPFEDAIARLLEGDGAEESECREAAETLHELGTSEALRRIGARPGHERARAILRDARWDVAGAENVPIVGQPGAFATTRCLVNLRLRRAIRLAGSRWVSGIGGGAAAGFVAGFLGSLVLRFGPGSGASDSVLVALPLVGLLIGGLGAAGVGGGLAAAETLTRSFRSIALVVLGALGGGAVGATAHLLGRLLMEGLFGRDLSPVAGGFEGLVIGAAVGFGYALTTPRAEGGMASPRGRARLVSAAVTGLVCAMAGMALGWTGSHLGAMSLDFMSRTFPGSQVGLAPLARLLGEESPGMFTRVIISVYEGLLFGFGLILGFTRRPRRISKGSL